MTWGVKLPSFPATSNIYRLPSPRCMLASTSKPLCSCLSLSCAEQDNTDCCCVIFCCINAHRQDILGFLQTMLMLSKEYILHILYIYVYYLHRVTRKLKEPWMAGEERATEVGSAWPCASPPFLSARSGLKLLQLGDSAGHHSRFGWAPAPTTARSQAMVSPDLN